MMARFERSISNTEISELVYKLDKEKQGRKKNKGTPGFEPGTSRSAVECSTTELYPL